MIKQWKAFAGSEKRQGPARRQGKGKLKSALESSWLASPEFEEPAQRLSSLSIAEPE
jgi:hypothetical protein